mgnify:CR=1 FL=1
MLKKRIITCLLAVCLFGISSLTALAADQSGNVGEVIYYRMELRTPWLWDGVKGQSNATFKVDYNWIQSGINGNAYIYIHSNDWNFSASKYGYVKKGTNNAETGDVEASGYRKDVTSTHDCALYRQGGGLYMELPSDIILKV